MNTALTGRLAAAASLVLLSLAPAGAEDPPGILWDTSSQMVMEGMPFTMPPNKLKLCLARVWTQPPPGGDQSCVNTNFQRSPTKATWDMTCTGERPMTGKGEMTFDAEGNYAGSINATSEGMTITIRLSGTKVGTCDNPIN
ncbi:MAG: DUF3617 domain-containing protein [Steroidobacteraceae bacterium]